MVFYCIEISKYELHNDPMQNSYVYIYVCITVVCLYMHIAKQALMMNFWRCLCVTYILHLEAQLTNEKKRNVFYQTWLEYIYVYMGGTKSHLSSNLMAIDMSAG